MKKTGLYLMLAGAAVSAYDLFTKGELYGAGKPLEKMKVALNPGSATVYYLSISDAAAVIGAYLYFR